MSVHRHLLQNAKSPAFPPGTFPAAPGHLSVPACLQIPLRRKGTQPPLRSVLSKCFVSSSSPRISLIDSPEVQRESQHSHTHALDVPKPLSGCARHLTLSLRTSS